MNSDCDIVLTKDDALYVTDLIETHGKHIKNVIYSTLGHTSHYLAQDTISELYLLMCKKIDVLKAHPCPKAWLLVAARQTAFGMIAKHRNNLSTLPLDEALNIGGYDDVFNMALYEIWIEDNVPEKLIASLTPREREVYHKIYTEDKKPVDVAKELNISSNTVNTIHKNIRDKIKEKINNKDF